MRASVVLINRVQGRTEPLGLGGSESAGVDWKELLLRGKNGNPLANSRNAANALRYAPEWVGVLGFNEFSLGVFGRKCPPWDGFAKGSEWTDQEDRLTAEYLQGQGINVPTHIAGEAVQTVARENPFHPLRDYLDSVRWDGKARLDDWPFVYLGVQPPADHENPEGFCQYVSAVGSRFLIQAVARIYRPGAKADCCLILEGPQGIKKSTALKTLSEPFFTDEIADLGSKDAAMQTRGAWFIEIAELDSMRKGDVGTIKAFISRSTDRFRPPYGRRLIESPRQCVFTGSCNNSTYLRDETGGRRFWSLPCTSINIDSLARDKDQLWAEAKERYDTGAIWWLDTAELNSIAEEEQSERFEGDPWESLIGAWAEAPSMRMDGTGHPLEPFTSDLKSVTVDDILTHCIGKRRDQWVQPDKSRVGRTLKSLGWSRYKARAGGVREWRYRRAA